MARQFLKLIVVLFLLQSAWAAAAQYCRHELGLDVQHFGHHVHQHKIAGQPAIDVLALDADGKTVPGMDDDCSYCHLGAMKSMPSMFVTDATVVEPPPFPEISSTYPHIVPRLPERPNWLHAA